MKIRFAVLASLALLAGATAARADDIDFTLTLSGNSTPITFTLDTTKNSFSSNGQDTYSGAAITASSITLSSIMFSGDGGNGHYYEGTGNSFSYTTSRNPIKFYGDEIEFYAATNSPSFTDGTYTLYSNTSQNRFAGTLEVSGAGATPEPSSFVLLGTGVLSLAGAARRRLVKA